MARNPQSNPRRRRSLGVPSRGSGKARIFTSQPVAIEFAGPDHRFVRADLEIDGVFHGEATYEGRVFFNNPKATAATAKTIANGYAGSFHILGHGGCLGDPGHCDVKETKREAYDFRPPHPLTPASKRVVVTAALREIAKTAREVTVTIVPIVLAVNELCDEENVFRFERMKILTYD